MARSKGKSGGSDKPAFSMVNVSFSPQHREEILSIGGSSEASLGDRILEAIDAGIKVSFSYDDWNSRYVLSLTDKISGRKSSNKVYLFGHKDPTRLADILVFVVGVFVKNDALHELEETGDDDW